MNKLMWCGVRDGEKHQNFGALWTYIIFLFVVECPHEELYIIVIFQSSLHHMSNQDQPDRSEESGELHQVGQHLCHAAPDHGLRHRGGITPFALSQLNYIYRESVAAN